MLELKLVALMEYCVFKDGKPLIFIESDNPDFVQNFFEQLKEVQQ